MTKWMLFISTVALGLAWSAMPAAAQFFTDDGDWPIFSFHRYGGDVNRPGSTPDRPYWHGDDAVPLYLRWHDPSETLDEYGTVVPPPPAQQGIVVGGAAVVVQSPGFPQVARHARHRRRPAKRVAKKDCIPTVATSREASRLGPSVGQ